MAISPAWATTSYCRPRKKCRVASTLKFGIWDFDARHFPRHSLPDALVKRKITFGYLYDFRNPAQWQRPWPNLYAETLEFITWTESIGFEGAWVPEHHGSEDGYLPSPLIALAAIAARTKTIKLGSAVALTPLGTTRCASPKIAR